MLKDCIDRMSQQRHLTAALAVLLLAAGGFMLYRGLTKEPPPPKSIPLVRTIVIGQTAVAGSRIYPGEVRGRYESQLAFQVAGKLTARLVNVGDQVRSGQVLMTLDPKDIRQSAEAAAAQLAGASANYKLAADNAARYSALYARGAVSEALRDQYSTQLQAADAALRQAQAQANASSNQLSYTRLLSDMDGVVASVSGEAGQVVAAGTPMATIVRSGEREIHINIPEGTAAAIGQKARISFWALPGIQTDGFIREIAPMADPVTRTYKICISVPELPPEAKLGMTARVALLTDEQQEKGFLLPASAVYRINAKPQVWLLRVGHATPAAVEISGYEGSLVRASGGLQAGDIVITSGVDRLLPGQEVRTEEGGER